MSCRPSGERAREGSGSNRRSFSNSPGEFNRKVCVSFWGDKAQDAATLKPGEAVTISANVESREYNGRWFTEVRAWRIVRKAAQQPQQAPVSDGLPPLDAFAEEPVASGSSSEVDDLPF